MLTRIIETARQDISRLKEELKRNGVHEKIYHSKILDESEAVLALHRELEPLRESLKAFHGLPADLGLAKQRVSPKPLFNTLSCYIEFPLLNCTEPSLGRKSSLAFRTPFQP